MTGETPSQTAGPYLRIGLDRWPDRNVLRKDGIDGRAIRIEGRVLDGNGDPVGDAMVEIWQADARGRYDDAEDDRARKADGTSFGFGRCCTDEAGRYWFETVKPGQVQGRGNVLQAPHVLVNVFARGMLIHATTRLYFSDETAANDLDPVLDSLPEPERKGTLIARLEDAKAVPTYRFDIRLQGEGETVFFDA